MAQTMNTKWFPIIPMFYFISPIDFSFVQRTQTLPTGGSELFLGPDLYFGSSWTLFIGSSPEVTLYGINLLALVILVYLGRQRRIAAEQSPLTTTLIGFNRVQCPNCGHANLPIRFRCGSCRVNLVEAFQAVKSEKTVQLAQLSEWVDWAEDREAAARPESLHLPQPIRTKGLTEEE